MDDMSFIEVVLYVQTKNVYETRVCQSILFSCIDIILLSEHTHTHTSKSIRYVYLSNEKTYI